MQKNIFIRVFRFYLEGFKAMTVGKTLWIIIIIKLFILFFVLKIFFFPNLLKKNFKSDEERSKHVIEQLTKP
jgi:flagellar basal body-associated protein FliL